MLTIKILVWNCTSPTSHDEKHRTYAYFLKITTPNILCQEADPRLPCASAPELVRSPRLSDVLLKTANHMATIEAKPSTRLWVMFDSGSHATNISDFVISLYLQFDFQSVTYTRRDVNKAVKHLLGKHDGEFMLEHFKHQQFSQKNFPIKFTTLLNYNV